MYARGATPLRPLTAGWQPPADSTQYPVTPAGTSVPALPAITPATNVPWNDWSRSSGALLAPGACEAARDDHLRASCRPRRPFGNPGGTRSPPAQEGMLVSTPSSTTATLTPAPLAPVRPGELGRADDRGPPVHAARVRVGSGRPSRRARGQEFGSCSYGRLTAKPSRSSWYRRETFAGRNRSWRSAIASRWAVSSRVRYERANELARFSFTRVPRPSRTPLVARRRREPAGGGSR